MVREITVDWNIPSGEPATSVFYFNESGAVAAQRLGLYNFLDAISSAISAQVSWSVASSGRELATATGQLTGAWLDTPVYQGGGADTGEPVADSSQAVFRWTTGVVVGRRFLRGRTFIPGVVAELLLGGNWSAALVTDYTAKARTFVNSASPPSVWHRPVNGAGGEAHTIDDGTLWPEVGILRRRRNR